MEPRWAIVGGTLVTPHSLIPKGLLVAQEGKIQWVGPYQEGVIPERCSIFRAEGQLVVPGFIDNHVHGGAGFDLMRDGVEGVRRVAQHLLRYGTTGFLPTTVSAAHSDILLALKAFKKVAQEGGAKAHILGFHLEGPYINRKKKGAQPEEGIREANLEEVRDYIAEGEGGIRVMTLAPEIPGGMEMIRWLASHQIIPSLGHTSADYETTLQAISAGAQQITHLFNAMEGFHHRKPSLLVAGLTEPSLRVELICDGVHVHPAVARLAIRSKGPDNLLLITDGMSAVGCPDGEYWLGKNRVYVRGNLCTLADGTLASSMLTMNLAVKNAMAFAGVSLVEAVRMASLVPAQAIGVAHCKGSLEVGKDADIAVLNPDFTVSATFLMGEKVYPPE
jgi:N-acetylglucosamine-6-phosphate deacetylase